MSEEQRAEDSQPMTTAFTLSWLPDDIAVVHIDVIGERVNTLKSAFAEHVETILAQAAAKGMPRGMIIMSGKPDSFIAGADIGMLDACPDAGAAQALSRQGQDTFSRLSRLSFPVVAAIHGACLGGGLELALACDYRICTPDDATVLGLPEVQLGLLPGAGGTQRLPRLIGADRALDLMLTGRRLRAAQAKKWGLVDDVVPRTILIEAAIAQIRLGKRKARGCGQNGRQRFLSLPFVRRVLFDRVRKLTRAKTQGHYPAAEQVIDVVICGLTQGETAGYAAEARAFGQLVMSPVSKALRRLFFASSALKSEAEGGNVGPLRRVGIVGGGLMGGGIAGITVLQGHLPVRIKDIDHQGVIHALRHSWRQLDELAARRRITPAVQRQRMSLISGGIDYQGFERADVVVEAVFEDLALKRRIVADIEAVTPEQTIFATNTSSLPIHQIADGARRPERIVGLHYFSPVEKMPLVEVIPHAGTHPDVVATVVELAKRQGKTAIVVADGAGFYVNRILTPYLNEAARCLLEGEPVDSIDRALVKFGFPVGPFALLDEVGLDVAMKIAPVLYQALGERFGVSPVLEAMLRNNRLGRKNHRGFYRYAQRGIRWRRAEKKVDDHVYTLLGVTPKPHLAPELIAQRCVMMMLNEAAYCLAESIIRSERDGDIGAVFGIGFPPFLGGPFHYMRQLGMDTVAASLRILREQYGERFRPCEALLQENGE
ncbi:fatty acid oxidation complex subunit alpha FadJ [Musicola keenii]|uniref:fatty acid oxidation complex subunit alpha FadJ n=1 Tax=Musicola keenii TaxID=2884250 RepID=UPI00177B3486|nr:fatty acid oxidation complex subunit alpha FadJ [Musicola keenii]